MGIKLLEEGRDDFLILEKASDLGGTWRDNTYPGCGCDVPAHLYSYSFAQNPAWSRAYARQPEILAYLRKVAGERGVDRKIVCDTAVTSLAWEEATGRWRLETADGRWFTARAVVSAVGALRAPKRPDLPGLDRFAGPAFHSSRWRHDVDLTGKRVAVIGTGASAIQIVPAIAPRVGQLAVYQRSPPWVLPREDRPISAAARWALAHLPGLLRLRRAWHYWRTEAVAFGLVYKPKLMGRGQKASAAFKEREIADQRLRFQLTPNYTLGCKRILISDDYYAAFNRDNVELVTDEIREVKPTSIVSACGTERSCDVLILATGFDAFNATADVTIRGRDGRRLADDWAAGPEAYRGVAVSGYPNLFFLMGPNSGLGHNSIIFMIEAQVRYILRCLRWLEQGRLDAVEVRPEIQRDWNERLAGRFRRTVWQDKPGGSPWQLPCRSWYVNPEGRNTALWPGLSAAYWLAMRRPRISKYLPAAAPPVPDESVGRRDSATPGRRSKSLGPRSKYRGPRSKYRGPRSQTRGPRFATWVMRAG
jgi:cation diffusion facilitator CzcD-associated flavoprotein CzcO